MQLSDFLLQRLDEDEAAAKAAITNHETDDEGGWVIVSYPYEGSWPVPPDDDQAASVSDEAWAIHATRHSPARVLADVEAKRRIVALHPPRKRRTWDECAVCFDPDTAPGDYDFETWPCNTLRALALPYADHPDYRAEWKP